jgi:hypothetical protein
MPNVALTCLRRQVAWGWRGTVSGANPARRKTPAGASQVECRVRQRRLIAVLVLHGPGTFGQALTAYGAHALPAGLA